MLSRRVITLTKCSSCCFRQFAGPQSLLQLQVSKNVRSQIQGKVFRPYAAINAHSRSGIVTTAASEAGDITAKQKPRTRRKLFQDRQTKTHTPRPQEVQLAEESNDSSSNTAEQHAQQQPEHEDPVKTQQQQGWWQHPSAASELLLYVFWDLDNLHPAMWSDAPELVERLRTKLQHFGRLQQVQAYANTTTLLTTVESEGVLDMVEEDELRCSICGRRCKSLEALQKHFKQLHEREHQKKMRGTKKFVSKYIKSEKAAKVRDASWLYGTPKKNRSGRSGQMVKMVLERAGVKVVEVANQPQAADEAIYRHLHKLIQQLAAADPKPPSSVPPNATKAAGQGSSGTIDHYLRSLDSAQACLQEMMDMSEGDLRTAWSYLRGMPVMDKKRTQWSKLWIQLSKARSSGRDPPQAPTWLSLSWNSYHSKLQEPGQQQEEQQQHAEAEATGAAAGLRPWGQQSTLEQAVLVIISDDRGFAASVAEWLWRDTAGAVLVTTRGASGWERPLSTALKTRQCSETRIQDVIFIHWDEFVENLRHGNVFSYEVDYEDDMAGFYREDLLYDPFEAIFAGWPDAR